MAASMQPYLNKIRENLNKALCLRSYPSELVERHDKPFVETRECPDLIMQPFRIIRNENQQCLVEASVNSCRVTIKIKQQEQVDKVIASRFVQFLMQRAEQFQILRRSSVKMALSKEKISVHLDSCNETISIDERDILYLVGEPYGESGAEKIDVDHCCERINGIDMEKLEKPFYGDISFLITNHHLYSMAKDKLVDFIIQFMQDVEKEISDMRIALNSRARSVAQHFLKNL